MEKLMHEKLDRMELKVDRMEQTISLLAVQSERIDNLSSQTKALWVKFDEAFKPEGYLDKIKTHQGKCPRDQFKSRFKELWVAYALMATLLVGVIISHS